MSLKWGGPGGKPTASVPVPSGADGHDLPQNKHALLDITPSAVERLNYVQYYPVVVFCEPESRQGIKAMRQWLAPDSRKSSRRLYAQASKMKKYCSHLFTATVSLSSSSNTWYEAIKDIIRTQQSQPVWTAAEQVWGMRSLWQGSGCRGCSQAGDRATHRSPDTWGPHPQADVAVEDSLDLLNPPSTAASGYLTCDSHANSDYDTDGETGAYTDGEDAYDQPGLARSSEPAHTSVSHGLNEQVSPPYWYEGLVGQRGVAQCLLMGGQFPSPVAQAGCHLQLLRIHAQLWFPMEEHSPAPGWGTNPAPTSDPSVSLVFHRQPSSSGGASGARATTASGTLRSGASRGVNTASPGAGTGPAEASGGSFACPDRA